MLERRRLDSEVATMEVINDSDTRKPVSEQDTMAVPYRWICLVRAREKGPNSSSYSMGTGVLIGPRHVLTAAHVLVSENDPAITVGDRLTVQPARNAGYEPFQPVGVLGWQVHPLWIVKHGKKWIPQTKYDYGLITLRKAVSGWKHRLFGGCELAYWGARGGICGARSEIGVTTAQIIGQEARAAGYPADRLDRPTGTLWTGLGRITFDSVGSVMLHTIDTYGGQSGAPIWYVRDGVHCLAGIHSRPGNVLKDSSGLTRRVNNWAVLITPDIARQLEAWKNTFAG